MNQEKNCSEIDRSGLENYRSQLREQLPLLLCKATREYRDFAAEKILDDVKSFTAYQAGCRAALNHLQILIKIAEWVHPNNDKDIFSNCDDDIDNIILDARKYINNRSNFLKI